MPRILRPHVLRTALAAWLLASCTAAPYPPTATNATSVRAPTPAGAVCQVGPDGGPVLADRGIGGTGITPALRTADRGIGGTGAPQRGVALADRGIGGTGSPSLDSARADGPGTGIVGVITGFASICVGGREVGFEPTDAIDVDGAAGIGANLRAGQVAAIEAAGTGFLRARRVAVRHEVSGPVEATEATGVLRVAGQRVTLSDQTWGDTTLKAGDWAEISGLRDADGTIVATRIDRRAPGLVVVHGVLLAGPDGPQIGQLRLRPLVPIEGLPGQYVTAFGRYENGALRAESVVADILAISPDVYFGPGVGVFVIESFAVVGSGRAGFGRGFGGAAPGLFAPGNRRVLVEYERRRDGIVATRLTDAPTAPGRLSRLPDRGGQPGFGAAFGPDGGAGRGRTFEPAPMPNRDVRAGPQRNGGPTSGGRAGGQGTAADRRGARLPDSDGRAGGAVDGGPTGRGGNGGGNGGGGGPGGRFR